MAPPRVPDRPRDDDVVPVAVALDWQYGYCTAHQAPVAAELLAAAADDVRAGGPLAALLPQQVRFGDLVGLRVLAAVHLLALRREASELAAAFPTLGGTPPVPDAAGDGGRALLRHQAVQALVEHPDLLRDVLRRVPQTNETGRAALLRAGLATLGPEHPVRLREIGCSAGLNLRADHLPSGPDLESGPLPVVVDRVGYDLDPVDPTTAEGRLRLSSYVWVDDVHRFRRLAAALDVAARVPVRLVRRDAADAAERLDLQPGTTTVLWHSAMWVYLPVPARRRVLAAVRRLGTAATPDARLAHLSWEWRPADPDDRETFELVLRRWPAGPAAAAGTPVRLAVGASHGHPARAVEPLSLAEEPLAAHLP